MADTIRTGRVEGITREIARTLVELTEGDRVATIEQLRTWNSVVLLVTTKLPDDYANRADRSGDSRRTFVVDHEGSFHRMADKP